MSPFAIESPMPVREFEKLAWGSLEDRLAANGNYSDDFIAATNVAFDVMAEIHRNEKRKLKASGWGNVKVPYIIHPLRMMFMALDEEYEYPHGFVLTSVILSHDGSETLAGRRFGAPHECVKYIVKRIDEGLRAKKLYRYTKELESVGEIDLALCRDPNDDYYKTARDISSIRNVEDALHGFEAKDFDRADNAKDLLAFLRSLGYGNEKKIGEDFGKLIHSNRSGYKSIIILNDSKVYSLIHRSEISLELQKNVAHTMWLAASENYDVCNKITNTLQNYTFNKPLVPDDEGRVLRKKFFSAVLERDRYYDEGGFGMVTEENGDNSFDGTMKKFDAQIMSKELRSRYRPSPLEIYRDTIAFKKLLILLVQKPGFYIRGMGLAKDYEGELSLIRGNF